MKYLVLLLIGFTGLTSIGMSPVFASENFYSFDPEMNDFSNISYLDYNNLRKDMITASVSNGEITKIEFEMKSHVKIQVKMQDDGFLYVNIPKKIMYLADHDCNSDAFLLLDREEVLNSAELQDDFIYDKNIKSWGQKIPKDSKEFEIVFAFIIPDAAYSYAFGQRCLMLENGEFMKPLKQKNLGLELHQITCRDGLELIYKKESRPACVKGDTFIKLFEHEWQARLFLPQHITLPEIGEIRYKLIGDAEILDVSNNPKSHITEIFINTKSKSNLLLSLERDIIGIPYVEDSIDYSVFVDGEKSDNKEPWGKNENRIIFQLNLPQNTKKITIIPS